MQPFTSPRLGRLSIYKLKQGGRFRADGSIFAHKDKSAIADEINFNQHLHRVPLQR
jgi:hypothetical protein